MADTTPKEKINPRYKVGIGAWALGQFPSNFLAELICHALIRIKTEHPVMSDER